VAPTACRGERLRNVERGRRGNHRRVIGPKINLVEIGETRADWIKAANLLPFQRVRIAQRNLALLSGQKAADMALANGTAADHQDVRRFVCAHWSNSRGTSAANSRILGARRR